MGNNGLPERVQQLREARQKALLGGGEDKIKKQHEKGKLTARERLNLLLDPGTFVEWDSLVGHQLGEPGDGIITGYGKVDGRTVCVYADDATVQGGTIGALHGVKMYKVVERALTMGVPFVGLNDSPGARAEKTDRLGTQWAVGFEKSGRSIFFPNTEASGVVPQISAILGACAGIAVYSPALTDFIFMVEGIGQMFITGPRIVKAALGEEISFEELGGAEIHSTISGTCDFWMKSEEECFRDIRRLLGYLPANCREEVPYIDMGDDPERTEEKLNSIVPEDPNVAYEVRDIIRSLADAGEFFEVKEQYAPEMVTGFARMNGRTVGFVANQPMVFGGALTVNASDKEARFIRFCDAFNVPLVLLVDTPAYAPGSEQEQLGIIRHGAKVIYALCEASVPKIVILTRKVYGGGWLGMGVIAGLGTDYVYAWPSAEIGIMGAKQTVELFYSKQVAEAADPDAIRRGIEKDFRDNYANPLMIVSQDSIVGVHIDEIIEPKETRSRIIKDFEFLRGKRVRRYPKKHGNIPL
ncbi:MAG: acyl-CoA carboxylase subunit beta [Chloroflexi bacterium]|nr:acyl-CoA carboxylase subunit beta [Chloroflexota bacterium]